MITDSNHIWMNAIIPSGTSDKLIDLSYDLGLRGSTIMLAKGSCPDGLLQLLGLDETRSEWVLFIAPKKLEEPFYELFKNRLIKEQNDHGVLFSMPVSYYAGLVDDIPMELTEQEEEIMEHYAIFTIVDYDKGQEVVDHAIDAGATGATVIHARGSGIQNKMKFFDFVIDPEKEMVLVVSTRDQTKVIAKAIEEKMDLASPGKGIMFVVPITKTCGFAFDAE